MNYQLIKIDDDEIARLNGRSVIDALHCLNAEVTAKELFECFVAANAEPHHLVQQEIRRILEYGVDYGFITRNGSKYSLPRMEDMDVDCDEDSDEGDFYGFEALFDEGSSSSATTSAACPAPTKVHCDEGSDEDDFPGFTGANLDMTRLPAMTIRLIQARAAVSVAAPVDNDVIDVTVPPITIDLTFDTPRKSGSCSSSTAGPSGSCSSSTAGPSGSCSSSTVGPSAPCPPVDDDVIDVTEPPEFIDLTLVATPRKGDRKRKVKEPYTPPCDEKKKKK